MRSLAVCLFFLLAPQGVHADPEPGRLTWNAPFRAISPSIADSRLVLLVITNDDPFMIEKQLESHAESGDQDRGAEPTVDDSPVWCGSVMARAIAKLMTVRPDLTEKLDLQVIAAGLPAELSGGAPRNNPSRAIVVLCDGQYRLLAFCVGVPDSDQLAALVEDAEDVQRSIALDSDLKHRELVRHLTERNRPRLSRMWRNVLNDVAISFDGEADEAVRADNLESVEGRIHRLAESLQPAYEVDARLRFGLSDQTDRQRLVILEQHPEARDSWCNTLTPFVAAVDVIDQWRELVETVWGLPPITAGADIEELQTWVEENLSSSSVVLFFTPPHRRAADPWPPTPRQKRGQAWHEVHNEALEHPSRAIKPQQLASLIRQRELRSIDVYQPSLVRYIVLDRDDSTPIVIRESDPPGRFAVVLQRSQPRSAEN